MPAPIPSAHAANPLLDDLTDAQRAAVLHGEGPLLVLAAAGSGKTRVITRRIAHLVREGVEPWSILALTFTNKAAGEMRERVAALLGEGTASRGLTVTTFHSLCARLLRRYAQVCGIGRVRPDFTIYDSADQHALMKSVLESVGLSGSNWPPRSILTAISHAKNNLMDAAGFAVAATDFSSKTVARAFAAYEAALTAANAVDFDDLLLLTARMLERSAQVRGECRARWRYLLIDEYQDTNRAQFVIARLLAGGTGSGGAGAEGRSTPPNICVVGDPDQAIYGWRGADISNILDFEAAYTGARVITLGENFRSTAPILGAADALIRHNHLRRHKDLFTRRPGGEKVRVTTCEDERAEARFVVGWLRSLRDSDPALMWKDMAVLYRTNALSRVVEDELRSVGVPYVIARGTAFYQREEVKHALAYLRVAANPADDVSLARVVNTPARGIGAAGLKALAEHAADAGRPMLDLLRGADRIEGASARSRTAMTRFAAMIDAWTGAGSFMGEGVSGPLADFTARIIDESGLRAMYHAQAKASQSETDQERLENLDELISSAAQFEQEYDPAADPGLDRPPDHAAATPPPTPPLLAMLRAYLESIALVADADTVDPERGAVTLMTLHAAKGLEFPAVAIIGLEEGLLPHSRSKDSEAFLEEERRLCFVGMTRAMRRLHLTCVRYRTIRGAHEYAVPSRFLAEMGTEHVAAADLSGADVDRPGDPRLQRRPSPGDPYPVGSMVRHPQFGLGYVVSVTGGSNARAQIRFRDVGDKTLVLEFARLQRVN
jgi:DNA helicase-2/ATP-dependent DNA helicase PcrA